MRRRLTRRPKHRPFTPHRRSVAALLLGAVLAGAFHGCGGRDDRKRPRGAQAGGTVVVGLLGDPGTLNPLVASSIQSKEIIEMMFLKLLAEEGDFLSFRPKLAESWSFSPDSLTITFRLREGLTWEDGFPVTADDVRFTWELQVDTVVSWPNRNLKERIRSVEVIDSRTVSYHFRNRYLYQLMDANDGVIVPKHLLESIPRGEIRTSGFGRKPVGNGPFKLSRWETGQYVELIKNPNYYDKEKPFLDRIVFRIVPDMTTLLTMLKSGEIDCLESIPADAIEEIESKYPDMKIYAYPSRSMNFIAWNLQNENFKDLEVRRALGMAINADEIIRTLLDGKAEVCRSPMHSMLWAFDSSMKPHPFDPTAARATLERLGWRDGDGDGILEKGGRPFEFEMITNQGNPLRQDTATMVQEYLRRIGVKVNVRILEWNTFIQSVIRGDYESCVLGWKVGTRADLAEFWRSTSTPPGGFNVSRYHNREVDSLIDRARNTLDIREAKALWFRCQRLIYESQPVYYLNIPYEVVALDRHVCGVTPNAIGFFVNLPGWYRSEGCP